ncbi:DNA repair protein RecO [Roseibium aquae]|uniref:DNA repair protein RecO n=1 Tax=Roseibium aquae TaxID=1323746 RepID=A0A916TM96_9HYPH|nr:DNA repair protein RecO [Roseibium aquae]GGB56394.1 DNA repair protein RecO [Roseibium aquae]
MEWTGSGIVLSARAHGERDAVLEVLSENHGRHLGLVRGGRSPRKRAELQPGNELALTWRARLSGHLGIFTTDAIALRAGDLMSSALGLHGVQHLAALMRKFPERDPLPALYTGLGIVLDHLTCPENAGPLLIRFELEVLRELGIGLDLSRCAATGTIDDLAYVSPKSARAVCREAGRPYHDKLLALPSFLVEGQRQPGTEIPFQDLVDGFALTGFFLQRHMDGAQDPPAALDLRTSILASLEKEYRQSFPWNFPPG